MPVYPGAPTNTAHTRLGLGASPRDACCTIRVRAGCESGQESFFDGLTWFGDQLGLSVLKPSDALRYRLSFQLRSVDGTLLREALLPNVAALPPTAYDGPYVYYRAASISSDRSELRRAPFLAIGR